jgi:DNA-binding MarR family transcriptional regulator
VNDLKSAFHPKAFLSLKRNVRTGLSARTLVLQILEKHEPDVRKIAGLSGLSYGVIVHHLRLLEAERVVVRKGEKKPFVWALTGTGQQRLADLKNNER